MQPLDLEPGVGEQLLQSGLGVAPKVIERSVERAIDRGHGGDEQQQGAVTRQSPLRGTHEIRVVLDVLHDVDGDYRVGRKAVADLFQVALKDPNTGIAPKLLLKLRDVVGGWLDEKELARGRQLEKPFGDGADACPGLDYPFAKGPGEGVDYPVVVVMGFGDRVELGAGICELANDGVVRKGLSK